MQEDAAIRPSTPGKKRAKRKTSAQAAEKQRKPAGNKEDAGSRKAKDVPDMPAADVQTPSTEKASEPAEKEYPEAEDVPADNNIGKDSGADVMPNEEQAVQGGRQMHADTADNAALSAGDMPDTNDAAADCSIADRYPEYDGIRRAPEAEKMPDSAGTGGQKFAWIILIAVAMGVLALGVRLLLSVSGIDFPNVMKIDVTPYISLDCHGESGSGTCDAVLDEDGVRNMLSQGNTGYESGDISLKVMDNGVLSNGDSVSVAVICRNQAIKLKKETATMTVSGLTDKTAVDVFADLEVKFTGTDGNVSCKIINHSTDPFVQSVNFSADIPLFAKAGSTVAVKASVPEESSEKYGKKAEYIEKTYVISNLMRLVESPEALTEDAVQNAENTAADLIRSEILGYDNEYDKTKLINKSFLVSGDGVQYPVEGTFNLTDAVIRQYSPVSVFLIQNDGSKKDSYHNRLVIIMKVSGSARASVWNLKDSDEEMSGQQRFAIYYPVVFYDFRMSDNGDIGYKSASDNGVPHASASYADVYANEVEAMMYKHIISEINISK